MSAHLELAAVIREMLMVRKDEVVTMELAAERANNIAVWLVMENELSVQNTSLQLNACSGKDANSTTGEIS